MHLRGAWLRFMSSLDALLASSRLLLGAMALGADVSVPPHVVFLDSSVSLIAVRVEEERQSRGGLHARLPEYRQRCKVLESVGVHLQERQGPGEVFPRGARC